MNDPGPILIATDLSPASDEAERYGYELARALGAEVVLLYTYTFPGPPGPAALFPAASQAVYAQSLRDLAHQAAAYPDVKTRFVVPSGEAVDVILAAAEELSPRLIVVGSHRLKGLEHRLVGSVAETLARRAPYSVLIAPGSHDLRALHHARPPGSGSS